KGEIASTFLVVLVTLPQLLFSSKVRSEEHTSELQSLRHLVCRLLLVKRDLQDLFAGALVERPLWITFLLFHTINYSFIGNYFGPSLPPTCHFLLIFTEPTAPPVSPSGRFLVL